MLQKDVTRQAVLLTHLESNRQHFLYLAEYTLLTRLSESIDTDEMSRRFGELKKEGIVFKATHEITRDGCVVSLHHNLEILKEDATRLIDKLGLTAPTFQEIVFQRCVSVIGTILVSHDYDVKKFFANRIVHSLRMPDKDGNMARNGALIRLGDLPYVDDTSFEMSWGHLDPIKFVDGDVDDDEEDGEDTMKCRSSDDNVIIVMTFIDKKNCVVELKGTRKLFLHAQKRLLAFMSKCCETSK